MAPCIPPDTRYLKMVVISCLRLLLEHPNYQLEKSHPSTQSNLGGGFKYVLFSPLFGEDSHFDEHIFQRGWFNHQLTLTSNPHPLNTRVSSRPQVVESNPGSRVTAGVESLQVLSSPLVAETRSVKGRADTSHETVKGRRVSPVFFLFWG